MDKKLLEIRNEIIKLREEKSLIGVRIEKLTAELQDGCDHTSVIETNYTPETPLFYAQPPRRICLICAIEEDGWGCGYKILREEPIRIVTKKEFYTYREFKSFEMKPVPAE